MTHHTMHLQIKRKIIIERHWPMIRDKTYQGQVQIPAAHSKLIMTLIQSNSDIC